MNDKMREALMEEAKCMVEYHPSKDAISFARSVLSYLSQQPESEPKCPRCRGTGKHIVGPINFPRTSECRLCSSPQPTPQVPDEKVYNAIREAGDHLRRVMGEYPYCDHVQVVKNYADIRRRLDQQNANSVPPAGGGELHTLLDSWGVPRELESYELTLTGRQKWAAEHLGGD